MHFTVNDDNSTNLIIGSAAGVHMAISAELLHTLYRLLYIMYIGHLPLGVARMLQ